MDIGERLNLINQALEEIHVPGAHLYLLRHHLYCLRGDIKVAATTASEQAMLAAESVPVVSHEVKDIVLREFGYTSL